jgi:hypothetical protein
MAATLSIAFTPPIPSGRMAVVRATRQLSPGVEVPRASDFKVITTWTSFQTSPADVLTAYTAVFGALISGRKVFFEVYLVGTATTNKGLASTVLRTSGVVT